MQSLVARGPGIRRSSVCVCRKLSPHIILLSYFLFTSIFARPLIAKQIEEKVAEQLADKPQSTSTLTPFRAVYKAKIKGIFMPLGGKGTRELIQLSKDEYLFRSQAKNTFASIIEESRFTMKETQIIPLEYQYHRTGIGKNREAILSFDWDKMLVLNNVQSKPWKMKVTDGNLDKLVYQLQLHQDLKEIMNNSKPVSELHYKIADGGRLKDYHFKITGEEILTTPIGQMNTIRIERIRQKKDRSTIFWLAPDKAYILMKLVQVEKKNRRLELLIKELEIGKAETDFQLDAGLVD